MFKGGFRGCARLQSSATLRCLRKRMVSRGDRRRRAIWCRHCRNCWGLKGRIRRYPKKKTICWLYATRMTFMFWGFPGLYSFFKLNSFYLSSFSVVRLGLSVTAGRTPISRISLSGRSDFRAWSRPEPAVDVWRLQIGSVATGEVAFAAGRPNVTHVAASDALLDEFVFLGRFQRNGVHAVSSANVAGIQPIYFQASGRLMLPTEEVRVCYTAGISVRGVTDPWKIYRWGNITKYF